MSARDGAGAPQSARASRPNILMIVADDLGCCDLGCYGNARAITPHIDRLAAQGVLFTHHYSASPMCAPARAALLTGQYPHKVGAIDVANRRGLNRVRPSAQTLPRVLRSAGYHTALIGKWHNGGGSARFHPTQYGYDAFCGFEGGASAYFDYTLERAFGEMEAVSGDYITDRLTDEAIAFIDGCGGAPFHLQLAYNAPHRPLEAPREDSALFSQYNDMTAGLKTLYAMVTRMDRNIGRLLSHLRLRGIARDTLVVFLSDNGPDAVGAGNMAIGNRPYHAFSGYKGDVLEGGIRVPAIAYWPGVLPAGVRVDAPSIFMDWLPTLCRAAGADQFACPVLDGRDLWPEMLGTDAPNAPFFWHWTRYEIINRSNMAAYHRGYKLYYPVYGDTTRYYEPDRQYLMARGSYALLRTPVLRAHPPMDTQPRLFYLPDDPLERNDLSAALPGRTAELCELMEQWHARVTRCYAEAARETLRDD